MTETPDLPAASLVSLDPPTRSTARVRVDGTLLLDELGRTVVLRGVNAGGRSKFAPFMPFDFDGDAGFSSALESYMDRLASWGINCVRLLMSWEAVEPEPDRVDEQYLRRYLRLIDAAWERDLAVLVDFHQDVYATPFFGDGFPPWTLGPIEHGPPRHDGPEGQWFLQYVDPSSAVVQAFDRLWSNTDGLLDRFEAMWRTVARRVGSHPGVLGFEVINEPGWGSMNVEQFEREVLPGIIDRMGAAIREEAPGALIACGGPGLDAVSGITFMANPTLDDFVFAPHYYDAAINMGGSHREDKVQREVRALAEVGQRWGRPVLFGEFNAPNSAPDQARYVRTLYELFDTHQVHATLWEASIAAEEWNHEDLCVTRADGSEKPIVDELVRPYPRAVAGDIERFEWDPERGVFTLAVTGANGITEVHLPTRHLGDSPRIGLSAGQASWHPDRGLLLVAAENTDWTLEVRRS